MLLGVLPVLAEVLRVGIELQLEKITPKNEHRIIFCKSLAILKFISTSYFLIAESGEKQQIETGKPVFSDLI